MSRRALKPDGILPATVGQDEAYAAFRKWTRRKLFAPHRLRSKQADSIRLQYVPLFVFSGVVRARYSGERGRTVGKGDKRRTSWTRVSGNLRWGVPATPVEVTDAEPHLYKPSEWPAGEAVGLREEYLLGATARSYVGSPKAAQALVHKSVLSEAQSLVKKDIGGEKQRVNNLTVEYESLGLTYVLGPFWTSSFYDRGKTFNFRVNGRTGKTTGHYPKSKPRVLSAVAAAVALVVLAVLGYQSSQHHDAVVAARAAACTDINTLWGDLYPLGATSPSASGLAQIPTTDSLTFDSLQSDARTAGNPYAGLAQMFVSDQATDDVSAATADARQIATVCQAAGNGYLVTNIIPPATNPALSG